MARLIVVGLVASFAWQAGMELRRNLWGWTTEIRFWGDIGNAFKWGTRANERGLFSIYERLGEPPDLTLTDVERMKRRREEQLAPRQREWSEHIDYGPLRLALMTYWVNDVRERHPQFDRRLQPPERSNFIRPLTFNLACEIVTTIGAFLVARHVVLWMRGRSPGVLGEKTRWRAMVVGLIAALVTWFNPVILFNAEGWPQWDIWPMPFFVMGLYCVLRRWWLVAGMLIGIAPALKGQILMVAWALPVCALVAGDWRGAIRFVAGAFFSLGVIALPWEIARFDPTNTTLRVFDLFDRIYDFKAIAWIATLVIGAILLPRKFSLTPIVAAAALGMWSTYWLMDGCDWWIGYSFTMGTGQYRAMIMGPTSNLAALLSRRFDWPQEITPDYPVVEWLWNTPLKTVLLTIYFSLAAFCAIIAGVHLRRRDPRWLIAICMPWLLFYAIPAQIHERYLLYFSACAGMFLACGSGWFGLGLVLTVLAFIPTIHAACGANGVGYAGLDRMWDRPLEAIHRFCEGTHPDTAWMLLLAVAIMLYGLVAQRMRGGAVTPS